jgi:hypothetical protein
MPEDHGVMAEVVITVTPHLESAAMAGSANLHRAAYDAWLDGRLLCGAVQSPFIAAARVLLAEGADPDAVLVMRRPGTNHDALRGRLGMVAGARAPAKDGPAALEEAFGLVE